MCLIQLGNAVKISSQNSANNYMSSDEFTYPPYAYFKLFMKLDTRPQKWVIGNFL